MKLNFKMIRKFIFFAVFLYTFNTYAQVTVGTSEKPEEGALLQLKNIDKASAGAVNATKGLGMPRVGLTVLNELTDLGSGLDKSAHTGLWVYNINEDLCAENGVINKGLYVWDGGQWQFLGEPSANYVKATPMTDSRDGKSYLYREFLYKDASGQTVSAGYWMLENLAYVPSASEATHGYPADVDESGQALEEGKFYMYPIKEGELIEYNPGEHPASNWEKKDGILYNWHAATQIESMTQNGQTIESADVEGVQGICPSGWHLPSHDEWMQLGRALYQNPASSSYYTNGTFVPAEWYSFWDLNPDETEKLGGEPAGMTPAEKYKLKRRGDGTPYPNTNGETPSGAGFAMMNHCIGGGKSFRAEDGGFDVLPVGVGAVMPEFPGMVGGYGAQAQFWTSSIIPNPDGGSGYVSGVINKVIFADDNTNEPQPYIDILRDKYAGYEFFSSVRCKRN